MALEHRISELDTYLFAKGRHYEIYEKMGAHLAEEDGKRALISLYGHRMQEVSAW